MRTLTQISAAVGTAVAVAGVLAACGGSTAATPVGASTPTAQASGSSVYIDCLKQHGVTVPTAFPSRSFTRPTGTARPTGVRRSGGVGGFGNSSQSPQEQAAVQACASVRPTNGFGGFGGAGRGGTQLVAFRNCMTQQGVTIPTTRPTTVPTSTASGARYLNGLNPSDPKVAAALKVCDPLLPSPGTRPTDSATN
jgi:hypothetical protein